MNWGWLAGAGGFIPHLGSITSAGILSTITRDFEQLVNAVGPTIIPTVDYLMELYFSGRFKDITPYRYKSTILGVDQQLSGDDLLAIFSLMNGCDLRTSPAARADNELKRVVWRQALEQRRPRFPPAFLRQRMRRAAVDFGSDTADMQRDNFERLCRESLKKEGFPSQREQNQFLDEFENVAVADILAWVRLGILDPFDAVAYLEAFGFNVADRTRVMLNRFRTVNESDMMAFAAKHATDEDFAQKWGLDSRSPDWWDKWADRSGLNYVFDPNTSYGTNPVRDTGPGGTATPQRSVGDLVWRAHWRLPGPSELAMFLHRFRGDPDNPASWNYPPSTFIQPGAPAGELTVGSGVKPLSLEEANQFMDAAGIPPRLRAHYYNTMYETVSMRHIRSFIAMGATNLQEATGWLLDGGLRPDLAARTAQVLFAEDAQKKLEPIKRLRDEAWKGYVKAVEDAYREGAIDRVTAENGLASNGVPPDVTRVELDTIDIRGATAVVQAVIRRTRADWFGGRTDELEARTRLGKAGVPDPRADQLIATWKAERGQGHQLAGTEKVLRWYRKGFIAKDEAIRRLSNLEWNQPDMLLLITEVEAEMRQDVAKTLTAADRDKRTQVREAEAVLGRMTANANRIMSHLRTIRPKADVLKWYAAGHMSEAEARQTLTLQGYDQEAIDNYLIGALDKKKKPAASAPPPKGVNANVTG